MSSSRAFRILKGVAGDLFLVAQHFSRGLTHGQAMAYSKALLKLGKQHLHQLRLSYVGGSNDVGTNSTEALARLATRARTLHALLPNDPRFSYSILIPTYRPKASYYEIAVRAALEQSAPNFEVLLGFDGPQPPDVEAVIEKLILENATYAERLKVIRCDREETGGGISRTTNALAAQARGNFLLLMDHDDWIRPDLLYRYEQTLRLAHAPENTVLSCNEFRIDERGITIPDSHFWKPDFPAFPYLFINTICHALLIPKRLWDAVGGENPDCDGAQDYDVSLRLDAAGAEFVNVPVFLYAWRAHANSTAKQISAKDYATTSGLKALSNYVQQQNLAWDTEPGLLPTTYRAKPRLKDQPSVHAVMLFRDQGELTIKCVQSTLALSNVRIMLTAVDNGSNDRSIGEELTKLGVEVLRMEEGFNFSRLNNRAVRETKFQLPNETGLLFINNDVELRSDALFEMCCWLPQPKVGIVGCRLHYPNGMIQHGGVELHHLSPTHNMVWFHTDAGSPVEGSGFSQVIRVAPAVTAACALTRRDLFLQIGGFDEIYYPVAYSDTNLCVKIQQRGLYCLYTPYAVGTHYEGASRGVGSIEDFETSRWLHTQVLRHNTALNAPQARRDARIFGAY